MRAVANARLHGRARSHVHRTVPLLVWSLARAASAHVDGPARVASHEYRVVSIVGDGRCLFRAVGAGLARSNGRADLSEVEQRDLADLLRMQAVEELEKRKEEVQWFLEEDFDAYVQAMAQPHTWGGEPEILMLAHVLKRPIHVYMEDTRAWYVRIAEYGDRDEDGACVVPIDVLFHGQGHYESLDRRMPELASKL